MGGNVTSDGGATVTERGVCWSTASNPTTSGNHQAASSGGTGSFTLNVTNLTPGTTYHVRAYATNSQGTSYGEDKTVTMTYEVAYTLDGTITEGSNGFAVESDIEQNGITWKVMGNTTMDPWRIGGKTI